MAKPARADLPPPCKREPERISSYVLAKHLFMTRQNVARLTAEGILERTTDGYLLDASRECYIQHLREEYRKSPRAAADADLQRHKARLLEMKVARQERETMLVSEHYDFMDEVVGLTLTELSSWPVRVAGNDLVLRRKAEAVLFELRVEIADPCELVPIDAASRKNDSRNDG